MRCNDVDDINNSDEIVSLVESCRPEIVITKEMEIPASALQRFPSSVRLMCEAGTGYNNIPIDLARSLDISVCNIPTYSNESVSFCSLFHSITCKLSLYILNTKS